MSKIRLLFLGTPEIASYCLDRLLLDPHFEVVGVVTQPDRRSGRNLKLQPSPVKKRALQQGISVLTPEKIGEARVLGEIQNLRAEAAVVIAYGQILPQEFLDLFPRKVVNLHASLLPRWRGAAPIQRAIMAGDEHTGMTLQIVVKKLDAGDILGVRKVPISNEMTSLELHDRLMHLGPELLHLEFMDYLRGNLSGHPQAEDEVTYAKKIDKAEGLINWERSVVDIHNQVRALAMSPGSWTYRDGKVLKIHRTQVHDPELKLAPGMVYQVQPDHLLISCGKGILKILEVQPESRDRLLMKTYLRGYPVSLGEMWG